MSWFSTIINLTDKDITKVDTVTNLKFLLVFNYLTVLSKDAKINNLKEIMKK